MSTIELDARKLLGFRLSLPAGTGAMGAKMGTKEGMKPGITASAKMGTKAGVKTSPKAGAKIGGKQVRIAR